MVTSLAGNRLKEEYFVADVHYNMICKWWEGHKWPVVPLIALPKTGIVISNDGTYICAGFLYRTDSCVFWTEFFVSNPDFKDKPTRNAALTLLIDRLSDTAKEMGAWACFASINNRSLTKRLTGAGYRVTDRQMTNLIKEL